MGITRTTELAIPPRLVPVLLTSERLVLPPQGQPSFRFWDAGGTVARGHG